MRDDAPEFGRPEVVARLEPTYTVLRDGVGTGPRDETEHLF